MRAKHAELYEEGASWLWNLRVIYNNINIRHIKKGKERKRNQPKKNKSQCTGF